MAEAEPPKDSHSSQCIDYNYVLSPTICVSVGSVEHEVQDFFVHEALISERSAFFAKAMSGPWKESEERKITLEDDEPQIFREYLQLLYTGKLHASKAGSPDASAADVYLALSKLYVLAEKLMDDKAKSTVMFELFVLGHQTDAKGMHTHPSLETIWVIYNGTPERSLLRKWLVGVYTDYVGEEAGSELFPHAKDFPHEFLVDLVTSMITFRPLPGLRAAKNRMKEELNVTIKELETTESDLNTVEEELNETITELETTKSDLSSVEEELNETILDLEATKSDLSSAKRELSVAQNQLDWYKKTALNSSPYEKHSK